MDETAVGAATGEERVQAMLRVHVERLRATLPVTVPELYARRWSDAPAGAAAGVPLRVAQFNVLADGLSAKDVNKGGFTESPPECLEWSFRSVRLLEELLRHGEIPDIIAMEEVDHFYDWFEPILAELGYEGRYISKPDSPCRYSLDPELSDGCALFWHKGKLTMLASETFTYDELDDDGKPTGKKANQVALFATLQASGSSPFVCAVTHLKATKSAAGERARAQQASQLVSHLHAKRLPCIVAADLNAHPSSQEILLSDYRAEAYPAMIGHALGLHSAYADVLGSEPDYTTWKRRGDREVCHTEDYILLSKGVSAKRILMPPEPEHVDPARFPGWQNPSDHVALIADIVLPAEAAAIEVE